MSSIGLYYPWMHFIDDNWVKLALLTWDKIARIRSAGITDHDSDVVREVREESDFLLDVLPSWFDLHQVKDRFWTNTDVVTRTVGLKDAAVVNDWPRLVHTFDDLARVFRGEGLVWIHVGDSGLKMSHSLQREFREISVGDPEGKWLGLPPRLGMLYLMTLADVVSRGNNMFPVTDDPRIHQAVGSVDDFDPDLPSALRDEPGSAYLHVALKAVIEPERLATVPVATLLKFRAKYAAELAAFRDHIAQLEPELREVAAVADPTVAHAHLESIYRTRTKPQLDELRRALRGLGVTSAAGTMALKIDLNTATGTALGGLAAAAGQPVVAGAAVALTVLPYVIGRLTALHGLRTQSPVAYLLAADRKLNAPAVLRAFRR